MATRSIKSGDVARILKRRPSTKISKPTLEMTETLREMALTGGIQQQRHDLDDFLRPENIANMQSADARYTASIRDRIASGEMFRYKMPDTMATAAPGAIEEPVVNESVQVQETAERQMAATRMRIGQQEQQRQSNLEQERAEKQQAEQLNIVRQMMKDKRTARTADEQFAERRAVEADNEVRTQGYLKAMHSLGVMRYAMAAIEKGDLDLDSLQKLRNSFNMEAEGSHKQKTDEANIEKGVWEANRQYLNDPHVSAGEKVKHFSDYLSKLVQTDTGEPIDLKQKILDGDITASDLRSIRKTLTTLDDDIEGAWDATVKQAATRYKSRDPEATDIHGEVYAQVMQAMTAGEKADMMGGQTFEKVASILDRRYRLKWDPKKNRWPKASSPESDAMDRHNALSAITKKMQKPEFREQLESDVADLNRIATLIDQGQAVRNAATSVLADDDPKLKEVATDAIAQETGSDERSLWARLGAAVDPVTKEISYEAGQKILDGWQDEYGIGGPTAAITGRPPDQMGTKWDPERFRGLLDPQAGPAWYAETGRHIPLNRWQANRAPWAVGVPEERQERQKAKSAARRDAKIAAIRHKVASGQPLSDTEQRDAKYHNINTDPEEVTFVDVMDEILYEPVEELAEGPLPMDAPYPMERNV